MTARPGTRSGRGAAAWALRVRVLAAEFRGTPCSTAPRAAVCAGWRRRWTADRRTSSSPWTSRVRRGAWATTAWTRWARAWWPPRRACGPAGRPGAGATLTVRRRTAPSVRR
ncbi:hypothetical protein NKH77_01130 [Streptomyces sp. M19]